MKAEKRRLTVLALGLLTAVLLAYTTGIPDASAAGENTISNEYLEIAVCPDYGYFTLGTTGGNPDTPADDNKILLYGHPDPGTSFTTIRVDGTDYLFNSNNTEYYNDLGGLRSESNSSINGYLSVKQTLTILKNPYTNREDIVQIKYTVTNNDTESHTVGTRIMLDTMLGENDGAPFRVPGHGNVTNELELSGDSIPQYWQAFDSLDAPNVVSTGTFYRSASERPDKVQFAYWSSIFDTLWEYSIHPSQPVTNDSAVAIYWNPTELEPGGTREYITYYGLGGFAAQDLRPPLALRVQAFQELTLKDGGDGYSPNPFTITAYVWNNGDGTAYNSQLHLVLPEGLTLRSGDTDVTLGDIAAGEERTVTWQVEAANQDTDITLNYSVKATADDTEEKLLTLGILVPGVKQDLPAPLITDISFEGDNLVVHWNRVNGASKYIIAAADITDLEDLGQDGVKVLPETEVDNGTTYSISKSTFDVGRKYRIGVAAAGSSGRPSPNWALACLDKVDAGIYLRDWPFPASVFTAQREDFPVMVYSEESLESVRLTISRSDLGYNRSYAVNQSREHAFIDVVNFESKGEYCSVPGKLDVTLSVIKEGSAEEKVIATDILEVVDPLVYKEIRYLPADKIYVRADVHPDISPTEAEWKIVWIGIYDESKGAWLYKELDQVSRPLIELSHYSFNPETKVHTYEKYLSVENLYLPRNVPLKFLIFVDGYQDGDAIYHGYHKRMAITPAPPSTWDVRYNWRTDEIEAEVWPDVPETENVDLYLVAYDAAMQPLYRIEDVPNNYQWIPKYGDDGPVEKYRGSYFKSWSLGDDHPDQYHNLHLQRGATYFFGVVAKNFLEDWHTDIAKAVVIDKPVIQSVSPVFNSRTGVLSATVSTSGVPGTFRVQMVNLSNGKTFEMARASAGDYSPRASYSVSKSIGELGAGYGQTLQLEFRVLDNDNILVPGSKTASVYLRRYETPATPSSRPSGGISGNSSGARERQSRYETRPGSMVADPVNTATGAHVIRRELLRVNGAQAIVFEARYNSLLLNEGPMGKGWSHNYETRLEIHSEREITVHWSAHRKNTFTGSGSGEYVSSEQACRFDRLVRKNDGGYTLTRQDGTAYEFNANGRLLRQINKRGQYLTMAYDSAGRLTEVAEPISGQVIRIHYNKNGYIDAVSDSLNRQVLFSYDGNGNLVGITDAGGTTTYSYNSAGQVVSATDPRGVRIFSNTYDEQGRVVVQDDAVDGNQTTRFTYDEGSQPGMVITTVRDRNGNTRKYVHDDEYKLFSYTDELGHTTKYSYDDSGNLTSVTDASGNVTTYTHDASGNLLSIKDPAGNVTRMDYDKANNLVCVTDPAGRKTTLSYDSRNNLTSVTDPAGNTTSFAYNSDGLMVAKTIPGQGTVTYSYEKGLPHKVTDPLGNATTYGYDAAGRLVSITDSGGNTTRMEYDASDNLIRVTDPLGNSTSFTYDPYGNPLTKKDPSGNVTRYSYNGNGKRISVVDPLLNKTQYHYDGEDRLVRIIDARGNATSFSYDAKGRLTGITDPLGNTRSFEYDARGNLVGELDAYGNIIRTISYDALNNPVSVTDALGNSVANKFDALGRITSSTDPLGRITRYSYDALDRLTSVTDAAGGNSTQGFDAAGNLLYRTDPGGNQTVFRFDKAGRLVVESSPASTIRFGYNSRNLVEVVTNGRGQTATYRYDAAGRLTGFTDPTGTVSYTYDPNGNVLKVSDENGTIGREYDALNRVVKYTDANGNTIRYAYDEVGNLVALTYPDGRQVHYKYDAANRLVSVTDWAGRKTSYEYDRNGRLIKTVRPNGTTLVQSYDKAGNLLQLKDITRDGEVVSQYDFTYDAAGNIINEKSANNAPLVLENIIMSYTNGNRLSACNGQPVEYDQDGNMVSGPLGDKMGKYTYDARNRLTSAGTLTYKYDAENNRIGVSDGTGQTKYVVDPNAPFSRVLIKRSADGKQTCYVYGLGLIGEEGQDGTYMTYHFDLRGSTVALTDQSGKVAARFSYGPYGELVGRTGTADTPFLYNGRDGVMTDQNGLYYMRARYYNPKIKRFVNQDIIPGRISDGQSLNRYAYVNGKPVSNVDPFGLARLDADWTLMDVADYLANVYDVETKAWEYTNKGLEWYGVKYGYTLDNWSSLDDSIKRAKTAGKVSTVLSVFFEAETSVDVYKDQLYGDNPWYVKGLAYGKATVDAGTFGLIRGAGKTFTFISSETGLMSEETAEKLNRKIDEKVNLRNFTKEFKAGLTDLGNLLR